MYNKCNNNVQPHQFTHHTQCMHKAKLQEQNMQQMLLI